MRILFVSICLLLGGCGRAGTPDTSGLEIGGLYSIQRPGSDIGLMEILQIDEDGTLYLRLYVNRFRERPAQINSGELKMQGGPGGMEVGLDRMPMPIDEFREMKPESVPKIEPAA
jgi:hypothetical protein